MPLLLRLRPSCRPSFPEDTPDYIQTTSKPPLPLDYYRLSSLCCSCPSARAMTGLLTVRRNVSVYRDALGLPTIRSRCRHQRFDHVGRSKPDGRKSPCRRETYLPILNGRAVRVITEKRATTACMLIPAPPILLVAPTAHLSGRRLPAPRYPATLEAAVQSGFDGDEKVFGNFGLIRSSETQIEFQTTHRAFKTRQTVKMP